MKPNRPKYRENVTGIMTAIRDAHNTKHSERILLWALALRANPEKGWSCWPSYSCIEEDTFMNEVTAQRAAKGLEEKGLIKRRIRPHRSNVFTICFDEIVKQAEERVRSRRRSAEEDEELEEADVNEEEEVTLDEAEGDSEDNDDNPPTKPSWRRKQ